MAAGPVKFALQPGFDAVPLTLSGDDVDLTDPAGQTGGYSAREFLIGATPGNLKVITLAGTTRTIPVIANQSVRIPAQSVFSTANGTTAAVIAVL